MRQVKRRVPPQRSGKGGHSTGWKLIGLAAALAAVVTTFCLAMPVLSAASTTGQIAGTVTASGKGPLQKLQVCAYEFSSEEFGGCAYTDKEGHYAIGGLASGEYRVEFNGGGEYDYLPQYYDGKQEWEEADPVSVSAGETTAGIDAVLQASSGSISGTVTDASTHKPIEGAYACAYRVGYGFWRCDYYTGEEGHYEITGLPAGEYKVQFTPPSESSYAPQFYNAKSFLEEADTVSVNAGETTTGIDAALIGGGQIAGAVTASGKGPLQKLQVCAYEFSSEEFGGCAYTDKEGHYAIGGLASGEYRVEFNGGGEYDYLPQYYDGKQEWEEADPVSVSAGETTAGIDAVLQASSGSISGTVTDASTHKPIEGAYACAYRVGYGFWRCDYYTGEEGHYEITGLPAGEYKVQFTPPSESSYAPQFYNAKSFLEEADTVSVNAGETTTGIDAALIGGGQIAGAVTASGKGPLQKLQVCAYEFSSEEFGGCAYTDKEGHYAIGGLASGEYRVEFNGGGEYDYLPQYYDGKQEWEEADPVSVSAGETTAGIDAVLQASSGSISGTVTDASTHKPIEGAYACAYRVGYGFWRCDYYTGEEGHYEITGLPAGEYKVQFTPPSESSYAPQFYNAKSFLEEADTVSVNAGETTTGIDAALIGGGQIAGAVTASGKGPLQKLQVCAYEFSSEEFGGCAYTDKEGHYAIGGLASGEYRVEFNGGGEYDYLPQYYDGKQEWEEADPVSVSAGETTAGIDAVLQASSGSISGTVTDASTHKPIEGAYACAYRVGYGFWRCDYYTGEEGHYEITGLPAGEYKVQFTPPSESSYAPQFYNAKSFLEEADTVSVNAGETTTGIDAALIGGGQIAGAVTASGKGPLQKLQVCAYEFSSEEFGGCAYTDKEGHYAIGGLASGEYRVEFNGGGEYDYLPQYYDGKQEWEEADPVSVSAGETTAGIDAVLQASSGSISGTVTDASTHKPIEGAYACAYRVGYGFWRCDYYTGEEGHYEITGLPAGEYKVQFTPPSESSYAPQFYNAKSFLEEADTVSVNAGETTTGIDAALIGGGQIAGAVTASGKGPLQKLQVCAYEFSSEEFGGCAYTDKEGHYAIGGLASGEYRVEFNGGGEYDYLPQYYDGKQEWEEADPVSVSAGETTAGIDAVLQASSGSISGTVTDASTHKPIEGAYACAYRVGYGFWRCDYYTGEEGHYEITGLPAGEYKVQFTPPSESSYAPQFYNAKSFLEEADTVSVNAGETTTGIDAALIGGGQIAGAVTASGKGPLQKLQVCAYEFSSEEFGGCAYTDKEGHYAIGGLASGEYRVEFNGGGEYDYLPQYYDGKQEWEEADPVSVSAGETTAGIDAVLGKLPPAPTEVSPPSITGTAQQGQTLLVSHGSWTNSPSGYSDQWLRCDTAGESCEAISDATGSSYVVVGEDIGHTLVVSETASNAGGAGETVKSVPTDTVTSLPLHAVAGEDLSAVAGEPLTFDGSASTPATEITSYEWSFGDGKSAEGETVAHAYAEAGTYEATLTVKRGGEQDSQSVAVHVLPLPAHKANIEVTDEAEQPISGAQVLYMAADGTRTEAITGSDGKAALAGLPDGTDTVYAWKGGFKPATGQVKVSDGKGEATVRLAEGEVVATTLETHEMTLKEIEEAGIDPNDPANNMVFEFEVALAFVSFHGYINEAGNFVGPSEFTGGGGWTCLPDSCTNGEVTAVAEVVEGHPLIEWLVLDGKVSILKQFFHVNMVIQNLAEEPFELSQGTATLNLPSGLSLAPTSQPQSLTQTVGSIAGGSSATASWIIRGDAAGEYNLSANYQATLEPFKAPVAVQAATAEPLKIWGVEALSLKVRGESGELVKGRPYHVQIGVMNKADIPLYNVAISIDNKAHAHFIFQPDQQFGKTIGELPPGETLFAPEFILVPDGSVGGITRAFAGPPQSCRRWNPCRQSRRRTERKHSWT